MRSHSVAACSSEPRFRLRRVRWHPDRARELTPTIRPANPARAQCQTEGPADQPDTDNPDRFAYQTVRPTADAMIRS